MKHTRIHLRLDGRTKRTLEQAAAYEETTVSRFVSSSAIAAAGEAIFDFIEAWYNPRRRHSALGYLSPIDFEQQLRRPE